MTGRCTARLVRRPTSFPSTETWTLTTTCAPSATFRPCLSQTRSGTRRTTCVRIALVTRPKTRRTTLRLPKTPFGASRAHTPTARWRRGQRPTAAVLLLPSRRVARVAQRWRCDKRLVAAAAGEWRAPPPTVPSTFFHGAWRLWRPLLTRAPHRLVRARPCFSCNGPLRPCPAGKTPSPAGASGVTQGTPTHCSPLGWTPCLLVVPREAAVATAAVVR